MKYHTIWFIGTGIGNVIEALYSVEYCLKLNLKCGVCIDDVPKSFLDYLSKCYPNLIVENSNELYCENLIHSWLYQKSISVNYENYFYINPDKQSVEYASEDETYLNVVKSIFPSKYKIDNHLIGLVESKPKNFISENEIKDKYVIYFGSSALSPVKRWPYFNELITLLKKENVIIVGGKDDLEVKYSFRYPKVFGKILNKKITNNINFWNFLKFMKLLIPHAHFDTSQLNDRVFINVFSWAELVYIFKRAKGYIGNDGGLSHLASASNIKKGITIFGPSSIKKNKPFNINMRSISTNMPCQPCYFNTNGVHMGKNYINCPYGIKCLGQISPQDIQKKIMNIK